jgi:hypothetical protein
MYSQNKEKCVLKRGQSRMLGSASVCVKKDGKVRRVKRDKAVEMVATGWEYCPKSDWRASKAAKNREEAPKKKEKKVRKPRKVNKKKEN